MRDFASGADLAIATRAGTRVVRAEADGQFTVDMGAAVVIGDGAAQAGNQRLTGLAISVGNPHLACMVDQRVAAIDLSDPVVLGPVELAAGANVEVIRPLGDREIEMRVHERGSGLTLSCGTGAVAAAVAAAAAAGEWPAGPGLPWTVHVPGGKLAVIPSDTASLLTGPAAIVAAGEISASWLAIRAPRLGPGSPLGRAPPAVQGAPPPGSGTPRLALALPSALPPLALEPAAWSRRLDVGRPEDDLTAAQDPAARGLGIRGRA